MNQATSEKLFYSVEESANIIGISRSVIYKMVKGGRFPCIQMGRRIMIPAVAINKLAEINFEHNEIINSLINGGN